MSIRILLADDHRIVREGLRGLLEKEADMEVVAEAEDGLAMVRLAQEMSPDIVVADVAMPNLNGIEATRQTVTTVPGIKVLALSMYSDRRFVMGMLSAGASGYLLKDCASEELVQAIRVVVDDGTYLSTRIVDVVVKNYFHHLKEIDPSVFSVLTVKEREVLQLLAEGRAVGEIACDQCLSTKTIETHRQHIMNKLNIHSIAELTKYAISEGLTSLER
jgi:DNA-binding NarL/FixJ family response regulator